LHVVDVVRRPGQEVAALAGVEVLEREPVELRLDLLAQPVDDLHDDLVEDEALQPVEHGGHEVHGEDEEQVARERLEVDAVPAPAVEDDVHGLAQHRRRPHGQDRGDRAEEEHQDDAQLVVLQGCEEAAQRGPERLRLARRGTLAPLTGAHAVLQLGDVILGDDDLVRGAARGAGGLRAVGRSGDDGEQILGLLLPAHASSSSRIWEATISRYVCDVSSSSSWVPRSTIRPSSRTRIWSASVMEETRWATMIVVAPRV